MLFTDKNKIKIAFEIQPVKVEATIGSLWEAQTKSLSTPNPPMPLTIF